MSVIIFYNCKVFQNFTMSYYIKLGNIKVNIIILVHYYSIIIIIYPFNY